MSDAPPVNPVITALRQLIRDARGHLQEKRLQRALETLNEARQMAISHESQTPDVVEAYGAIEMELALLHQQLNDARGALNHYQEAEAAFRKLPIDDDNPRVRLQLATCLVNMTGLLARERMLQSGLDKSGEAIMLLRGASQLAGDAPRMLLLGALQNKSALLMEARQLAEAEPPLAEAVEIGADFVQRGQMELLPQVIDATGRLANMRRMLNRPLEALAVAERAARWAEAAWQGGAAMGQRMFVASQFQLVDVHFGLGRFSLAEDHLWKGVEAARDLQSAVMAHGFYCALLRIADEALESGNLPREEVLDAIVEAEERVVGAGAQEDVLEVIRARQSALTAQELEPGTALLGRYGAAPQSASGGVRSLLPLLQADLQWLKAGGVKVGAAPEGDASA
jgi:tetratricopeptide (TPR) repeat protein